MKTSAFLAGVLAVWVVGCAGTQPGTPQSPQPHAQIYSRTTNDFAYADFYKPAEPKTRELSFTLAPLILQQVSGGTEPTLPADRFGAVSLSNGLPVLDLSRPTIYWNTDTVQVNGKSHVRFSYVWCYFAKPGETAASLQGIRITLNSSAQPAIWEVLTDKSSAKILFVSRSLEAGALAEFGMPLPGRRYAIERGVEVAPEVVVARVIEDGPIAMGPIVYLNAGTCAVSTLICRCMPAQAKKLVSTATYDLQPWHSAVAAFLTTHAAGAASEHTSFWPGEADRPAYLESCLRLPRNF